MVYIIDKAINKVRDVPLGSPAMMAATTVYQHRDEADQAFRDQCTHPTRLGNSRTGRVFCADCSTPL